MTIEIISVGTEILLGNIVNTNAAFLAKECANLGLNQYYQTVVGDNDGRLSEVFRESISRSDFVILTGGLGPTEDDLTKETVAKVLNIPLVEDALAKTHLEEYFAYRGLTLTENNYKQALVPENSIVLQNANGTAPGMIVEKDGHAAILLPGPPSEMVPMFQNQVLPYLESKSDDVLYSITIKECGIGESILETMLLDLIDAQTNPTIATYAKISTSEVRVTAKAKTREAAIALVRPIESEILKRLGNAVYAIDGDLNLEDAVFLLLKKHQLTISTAESCTGGLIASKLVNVSGISSYFSQSYVTYSNSAKHQLLGVEEETLNNHTAVSKETAKEMVNGCAKKTGSDVAIAVTGYAGPDDSDTEPKGLVYIAVCVNQHITVKEFHFNGNRSKIRECAAIHALNMARLAILEEYDNKGE